MCLCVHETVIVRPACNYKMGVFGVKAAQLDD